MNWHHNFTLISLLICLLGLLYHFVRLIRLGLPHDYSKPVSHQNSAITYSFLGAMNPRKKESAYLHLPTYAAGLMYHIGTAAAIVVFILLFLFNIKFGGSVKWVLFGLLSISGFCGIGILGKRLTLEKMRYLSSPDDYISNILVTLFHLVTLGVLVNQSVVPIYNFCVALLLLYLPFGKLKHLLYFFAARYHLGLFYGWRGIWPVKRS